MNVDVFQDILAMARFVPILMSASVLLVGRLEFATI